MAARKKSPVEAWNGQRLLPDVSTEKPADVVESTVLGRIRAVLERMPDVHVMRNNVGLFKSGRRWIRTGLGKGSSDIVAIVGPHGRWLCIETKRPKGGRTSEDQEKWIAAMRALGAVAGVVTTIEEAVAMVAEARKAA